MRIGSHLNLGRPERSVACRAVEWQEVPVLEVGREREKGVKPEEGKTMRGRESERSASPPPGFGTKNVGYSSGETKRKDDLNRSSLPLLGQGGATVSLTTRLRAERDQGRSIFLGRFVEVIRETSIRRDILSIVLLR